MIKKLVKKYQIEILLKNVSFPKNFAMNNIIAFVIRKIDYRFFLFSLIFSFLLLKSEITNSKKMINVYGKYFECKSPKNSFERTRGVKNRICIFSKKDKEIIDKMRKEKKSRK